MDFPDTITVELGERQILEPPRGFNERLRRLGGLTPNGLPYFRLSWGHSRLSWLGGFAWKALESVRDKNGDLINVLVIQPTTRVPKYWPALDRWYLEMWYPPEAYGSPEYWRNYTNEFVPEWVGHAVEGPLLPAGTRIERMGPYPDRGEYEPAMIFQEVQGSPLTAEALENAVAFVRQARYETGRHRYATAIAAARAEEEANRKKHDNWMAERWEDLVRESVDGKIVSAEPKEVM